MFLGHVTGADIAVRRLHLEGGGQSVVVSGPKEIGECPSVLAEPLKCLPLCLRAVFAGLYETGHFFFTLHYITFYLTEAFIQSYLQ